MGFGTNTTLDLIGSRFQYLNQRVAQFGMDNLTRGIRQILDSYNDQAFEITGDLAGTTDQRLMLYGTGDRTQMIELDEYGDPPPQKAKAGQVVGMPLKKYGYSWQGTRQYFAKATAGEVLQNTLSVIVADQSNMIAQVLKAIYIPTNYTFSDDLVDHITLTPVPVKRLLNADGLLIPPGPNGETFDATTHTHYLGTASFVAADMVALKETVLEHYNSGEAVFVIPRALAATIATFTGNFVPLHPTQVVQPTTASSVGTPGLNTISIANREVGLFDGIPVVVKPWAPAGKVLFYIKRAGGNPVCMIRTDPDTGNGGSLGLEYDADMFQLIAKMASRDFGVGVLERSGAAILDTANASYTAPTIAA